MALFDLETSEQPYGLLAALSGEIDLSTVGEVEQRLQESYDGGQEVLALDLRRVNFLDSSGLRLILRLNQHQRDAGRRLVVVQGPRRVARVFELSGVEGELEIVADASEIDRSRDR